MKIRVIMILLLILFLAGCQWFPGYEKDVDVGLLLETSIDDRSWGQQGYQGLQAVQEEYGVDIYYKEEIRSYQQSAEAVEELVQQGAEVIFGHSNIYGSHFRELHEAYPEIDFIYFNGQFAAENVTSLNFDARAMGFFGGMVAGEMTKADQVGLIGAFEWQPEVEGFYEGVKYQNPEAEVDVALLNSWENTELALMQYERMKGKGADVFYPAGDLFAVPIIEQAEADGHLAVGYLEDQSSIAAQTVLTSTVQNVDEVYKLAMERYLNGGLPGEALTFDFSEGAITMGEFSPVVPEEFRDNLEEEVENYKETGTLPQ
ncbi:BMP family ABC transporter substrate-binding protein [Halobacillus litoralis]|uniref:BMP family ABC transporter substrate-binding protein n=1 Tax=Halobacillus litoralis TaxID=45668 RepID=UPI001F0089E0|nr:BMP family ABC transporter substrate-binding protein [Halobacillus litoralis]